MTFMGIDNQTSVKPYPLFQYQYLLIMDICMETQKHYGYFHPCVSLRV